jgi:RNA polymerase sigma-70 factor (sigma-E family)
MYAELTGRDLSQVVIESVPLDRGTRAEPPEASITGAAEDFETCAEAWTAELARLAYLLTGDPDTADDLVADALFAAWERWPTVLAARSPKAYVRRIVVNLAASLVRRQARGRAKLRLIAAQASDAAPAPDLDGGVDLRQALEALPRGQRECVVLRYGMDLPEAEVAEVLAVSVGTVKSQTSKGSARLRHLLGSGPSV